MRDLKECRDKERRKMKEYHKIHTVWKRDENGKMLIGQYSKPEFEYLSNNRWIAEEKIDGTNIRVMFQDNKVTFGGKTDNAELYSPLVAKLQDLFPASKFQEVFNTDSKVCLYGEGYGARIQKGGGNYIPDGVDFILFDVVVNNWWLKRTDVYGIAEKFNIKHVPIFIQRITLQEAVNKVKSGFYSSFINSDRLFFAEGLILRPEVDLFDRKGDRIICKLKTRDFA